QRLAPGPLWPSKAWSMGWSCDSEVTPTAATAGTLISPGVRAGAGQSFRMCLRSIIAPGRQAVRPDERLPADDPPPRSPADSALSSPARFAADAGGTDAVALGDPPPQRLPLLAALAAGTRGLPPEGQ